MYRALSGGLYSNGLTQLIMSSLLISNRTSPHTHSMRTVNAVMGHVMLALLPGIVLSVMYFGISILFNLMLAVVVAIVTETLVLRLRGEAVLSSIRNCSAVVTAILFALALSPLTTWWVTVIGIIVAIVLGKQIFGGIGNNPFNPAMTGYAFIMICFPAEMAYWPDMVHTELDLSFTQELAININGLSTAPDGYSGATPLSHMQLELGKMKMVSEITTGPLYGAIGGAIWQWLALAWLAGGIWLLINKIIRWQIPASILASLFVISALFNMIDSDIYPSAIYQLFTGGVMLCAFFIATDPASSSTTPRGKIIYGIGIGCLIYIIRTWGSYPDGVAFAVLIMNAMVPLIDYYTRPKVPGEK